jgi:hypothetical protein
MKATGQLSSKVVDEVYRQYGIIIGANYKEITLISKIKRNSDVDTDKDKVSDYKEVYDIEGLVKWDDKDNIIPPSVLECMKYKEEKFYVTNEIEKYAKNKSNLFDVKILPIKSDPSEPDTDGDKLDDCLEREYGTNPFNPDSDGDGGKDGEEVTKFGTSPLIDDNKKLWEKLITEMDLMKDIRTREYNYNQINTLRRSKKYIEDNRNDDWRTLNIRCDDGAIRCYSNALNIKNTQGGPTIGDDYFIDAVRLDIGYFNVIPIEPDKYASGENIVPGINKYPDDFYLVAYKSDVDFHIIPFIYNFWYDGASIFKGTVSQPEKKSFEEYEGYVTQDYWGNYYTGETRFIAVREDWQNNLGNTIDLNYIKSL